MQKLITEAQHDGMTTGTSKRFAQRKQSIGEPRRGIPWDTLLSMAYRRVEAQIAHEDSRTVGCVQHVKDGKPLTKHGAKMLGVKWEGPET